MTDRLSELQAQVKAVQSEYDGLARQRARLEAVVKDETAVLAEIGALGHREVEAMAFWDGVGSPPAPLTVSAVSSRRS